MSRKQQPKLRKRHHVPRTKLREKLSFKCVMSFNFLSRKILKACLSQAGIWSSELKRSVKGSKLRHLGV